MTKSPAFLQNDPTPSKKPSGEAGRRLAAVPFGTGTKLPRPVMRNVPLFTTVPLAGTFVSLTRDMIALDPMVRLRFFSWPPPTVKNLSIVRLPPAPLMEPLVSERTDAWTFWLTVTSSELTIAKSLGPGTPGLLFSSRQFAGLLQSPEETRRTNFA